MPQFHDIRFSAEGVSILISSEQRSMTFAAEAVSILMSASDLSLSAILLEDGDRLMTEAGFRVSEATGWWHKMRHQPNRRSRQIAAGDYMLFDAL